MESLFVHNLIQYRYIVYTIIFFGIIFEGDILLFSAGFLASQKYVDLGDVFFIILSGTLIGNFGWYYLGHRLKIANWNFLNFVWRLAKPFDNQIIKRPAITLLVSKFIYSLHHPLLIRSGFLGLGLRRFLKIDVLASTLWIVVVGGLGYFFGTSFALMKNYLRYAEIGLLIAVIIFILVSHLLSNYTKKELDELPQNNIIHQ